jgi:hypothetical protein
LAESFRRRDCPYPSEALADAYFDRLIQCEVDLANVRRERDRLGQERDQINAECHRVTAIAERKILELHRAELQRDAARAKLEQFGKVLYDASMSLGGFPIEP